jgi:hypothetical protein
MNLVIHDTGDDQAHTFEVGSKVLNNTDVSSKFLRVFDIYIVNQKHIVIL